MTDRALSELLAGAIPFSLELRVPFRGLTHREGVLIKGPYGWGEFAPFDDYSDVRAGRWLRAAVEAAFTQWPETAVTAVEVNAIIPGLDASLAGAMARAAITESGCTVMKVKVGSPELADDEARVVAVRDALDSCLGAGVGRIRLDANGAWQLDQAIAALRRLTRYGVELVEQPCAELSDIAEVRSRIDVPIAVDECLRLADDPATLDLRGSADRAVIKPATVGGMRAALELADSVGLPVLISGSLDSSVGLMPGVQVAAVLSERDSALAAGLGTGRLLAKDLVEHTVVPQGGHISVHRVQPSLEELLAARDQLSEERAHWWRERLQGAWNAGGNAARSWVDDAR
ncbi:MAG: hypothetical protein RJB01_276 [Actinomycetota bacterium]